MAYRASLEEIKEFANAVRAAGGGNPLDALMPAVPTDASRCLIARNLNFNCEVAGTDYDGPDGESWVMLLDDAEVAEKIARELELNPYESDRGLEGVYLPAEIGEVASRFDKVQDYLDEIDENSHHPAEHKLTPQGVLALWGDRLSVEDVRDFLPYIEEAVKETYSLADLINEDGSIVI